MTDPILNIEQEVLNLRSLATLQGYLNAFPMDLKNEDAERSVMDWLANKTWQAADDLYAAWEANTPKNRGAAR